MVIRGILQKNVRVIIAILCLFFNIICNKLLDFKKLYKSVDDTAIILCQFEMYFPPTFFDIMVCYSF